MNKYFILCLLACIGTADASSINIVSSSPITGAITRDPSFTTVQGDYASFTNPQNIALGRTATVSGTISGYPSIHNASNLTDGNYGNGRSWIGDGANSFFTIDFTSIQNFDTVLFGRDRLGGFADRNPGQFSIAISNDNSLFTQIIDSSTLGFSGTIGLGETIETTFSEVSAQYVRFAFENSAAAIDEVEIMNSTIASVPAPAAIWLLASGLIGVIGMRKKSVKLSTN